MDDSHYQPIYDKAMDLQYKFHDFTAGVNHPESHLLGNEIRQLTEDIAVQRNPRSIEDRIKAIQLRLDQTQHTNAPIMHEDHHRELHTGYEQMKQAMKHFENY